MKISTKKGDTGYTSLLRGDRVPKYHIRIETAGALDEANSFLGLARVSAKEDPIKEIILLVQKHLFMITAEISDDREVDSLPKKNFSQTEVDWLDSIVERYEKVLALPSGFVAFGKEEISSPYECCSHHRSKSRTAGCQDEKRRYAWK